MTRRLHSSEIRCLYSIPIHLSFQSRALAYLQVHSEGVSEANQERASNLNLLSDAAIVIIRWFGSDRLNSVEIMINVKVRFEVKVVLKR